MTSPKIDTFRQINPMVYSWRTPDVPKYDGWEKIGYTGLQSVDDRIAQQAKAQGKSTEAIRQMFVDRQPMGRLGTAEEIASMVVYLASDESSYATGQAYLVDGGFAL